MDLKESGEEREIGIIMLTLSLSSGEAPFCLVCLQHSLHCLPVLEDGTAGLGEEAGMAGLEEEASTAGLEEEDDNSRAEPESLEPYVHRIAAEKGKMRLRAEHKMREKGWEELTFVSQPDSMETRPLIQDGAARPPPPCRKRRRKKGRGSKLRGLQQPWQLRTMRRGRGWWHRGRRGCAAMGRESTDWGRKRRQLIGGEWF
jgi:hypothetical protein